MKTQLVVSSVDPMRSRNAQRVKAAFALEGFDSRATAHDVMLLGGGGYLNGSWVPEIHRKLHRLIVERGNSRIITHSVEVRRFDSRGKRRQLGSLFKGGLISVRDVESERVILENIGLSSEVLPDAISLLYPYLENYIRPVPEVRGKIVLNLLDISRRGDSSESELPVHGYRNFFAQLIERLGDSAVGLVVGDGDYSFMKSFPRLQLVQPKTVSQLVSVLEASAGVFSVRMHPALISSALRKPVVVVPYCGKVRPTLRSVGIEHLILDSFDVDSTLSKLEIAHDSGREWNSAHIVNRDWLVAAVSGLRDEV